MGPPTKGFVFRVGMFPNYYDLAIEPITRDDNMGFIDESGWRPPSDLVMCGEIITFGCKDAFIGFVQSVAASSPTDPRKNKAAD